MRKRKAGSPIGKNEISFNAVINAKIWRAAKLRQLRTGEDRLAIVENALRAYLAREIQDLKEQPL